jgi:hypothetical protein
MSLNKVLIVTLSLVVFTVASRVLASVVVTSAPEKLIELQNPSFEGDLSGWSANGDNGMSLPSPEAAHTGKIGLRVTDNNAQKGSSLATERFPVSPGKNYQSQFWARTVSGDGIGVYLRFFDAGGKMLTWQDLKNEIVVRVPGSAASWSQFLVRGVAPKGAASISVWIHSFSATKVVADFDDFTLVEIESPSP